MARYEYRIVWTNKYESAELGQPWANAKGWRFQTLAEARGQVAACIENDRIEAEQDPDDDAIPADYVIQRRPVQRGWEDVQ